MLEKHLEDHPSTNKRRDSKQVTPRPFSSDELARALVRPDLAMEYVLGGGRRIGAHLSGHHQVMSLLLLLMTMSVLGSIPYGLLSPSQSAWRIAALYTGSVLICFPCLHVFSKFLGFEFELGQTLVLALVGTATAALFTLGFAPIIWFIGFSMPEGGALITPSKLSVSLLVGALLFGFAQMNRCLEVISRATPDGTTFGLLVIGWLPLLLFITYRMALVIELGG